MNTDDLVAALREADLTAKQRKIADELVAELAPRMEEPGIGEWVMAACIGLTGPHQHVNIGVGEWLSNYCSRKWTDLLDPRPLTLEEYDEYAIQRPAAPITKELIEKCAKAAYEWGLANAHTQSVVTKQIRAALKEAGHKGMQDG